MVELSPPSRFIQQHKSHMALAQEALKIHYNSSLPLWKPHYTETPGSSLLQRSLCQSQDEASGCRNTRGPGTRAVWSPSSLLLQAASNKRVNRTLRSQKGSYFGKAERPDCLPNSNYRNWTPAGFVFHHLPLRPLEQWEGDHWDRWQWRKATMKGKPPLFPQDRGGLSSSTPPAHTLYPSHSATQSHTDTTRHLRGGDGPAAVALVSPQLTYAPALYQDHWVSRQGAFSPQEGQPKTPTDSAYSLYSLIPRD